MFVLGPGSAGKGANHVAYLSETDAGTLSVALCSSHSVLCATWRGPRVRTARPTHSRFVVRPVLCENPWK